MRLLLALVFAAGCGETAAVVTVAVPAREPPFELVREDPSDAPIPGISAELVARFEDGDARFELPFREAQGLGPLYIHRACESCHEEDRRGPGTVRRIARLDEDAPLPFGDVVRPRMTAGAVVALGPPDADDARYRVEIRLGPPLFARGYMEAIPDETLIRWARAQSDRDDAITGRVHHVAPPPVALAQWMPTLGRFGLKARVGSLSEFVADALAGDMGLTSELRPVEPPNPDGLTDDARPGLDIDRAQIELIADYVRLIGLPAREPTDPAARRLFDGAQCSVCHIPTAQTRTDHPLPPLRDVEVALYSDMLLHDLGAGLADGIEEGEASGREWRTAPLIGLRYLPHLLHDGRADSVESAIAAHASEGSEANDSIARFDALSPGDRARVIAFVEAL